MLIFYTIQNTRQGNTSTTLNTGIKLPDAKTRQPAPFTRKAIHLPLAVVQYQNADYAKAYIVLLINNALID